MYVYGRQVTFCPFCNMSSQSVVGMLIYFRSGNFLALRMTFFSKGHAEFFREFLGYLLIVFIFD